MRRRALVPLSLLACGALWAAGDAKKGGGVFLQQCGPCHSATTNEKKLGPGLKGLFKIAKLPDGKKPTEANVRARIDSGGNGMPPYKDLLTDQEKDDLIAYLKTL
jgi:mono/diheme cytochrome c family protein